MALKMAEHKVLSEQKSGDHRVNFSKARILPRTFRVSFARLLYPPLSESFQSEFRACSRDRIILWMSANEMPSYGDFRWKKSFQRIEEALCHAKMRLPWNLENKSIWKIFELEAFGFRNWKCVNKIEFKDVRGPRIKEKSLREPTP